MLNLRKPNLLFIISKLKGEVDPRNNLQSCCEILSLKLFCSGLRIDMTRFIEDYFPYSDLISDTKGVPKSMKLGRRLWGRLTDILNRIKFP